MDNLRAVLGLVLIPALALLCCPRDLRRRVNWRTVGGAYFLLVVTAFLVLKTPLRGFFKVANDAVDGLLGFCNEGAAFLFGELARRDGAATLFAFKILPTIIFFAALFSVLYYFRVLPFIVKWMGRGLSKALGTSGAESFSTVADIFVGQTEAPLTIRPYIPTLTLSELNACMTAGFATTAGGVLAAYCGMLQGSVPEIAGHLIACSVMCAPASMIIAKLLYPESGQPKTAGMTQIEIPKSSDNFLDSLAVGTTDGLKLAVNVGAMLVTFTALTYLLDAGLGWLGREFFDSALSLKMILSKLFWPVAWLLGAPSGDTENLAALLGQKTAINEFVAYMDMSASLAKDPSFLSERGRLIASYALCGFANFASIGIQIGGYSGLCPERRADFSRLALRAMFGGFLTTCLVATLAGILA